MADQLTIECPQCHALPGEPCIATNGNPFRSRALGASRDIHIDRTKAALNVTGPGWYVADSACCEACGRVYSVRTAHKCVKHKAKVTSGNYGAVSVAGGASYREHQHYGRVGSRALGGGG